MRVQFFENNFPARASLGDHRIFGIWSVSLVDSQNRMTLMLNKNIVLQRHWTRVPNPQWRVSYTIGCSTLSSPPAVAVSRWTFPSFRGLSGKISRLFYLSYLISDLFLLLQVRPAESSDGESRLTYWTEAGFPKFNGVCVLPWFNLSSNENQRRKSHSSGWCSQLRFCSLTNLVSFAPSWLTDRQLECPVHRSAVTPLIKIE